jgi:cytochrome P450
MNYITHGDIMLTVAELDADPHKAFARRRPNHRIVEYEGGGFFVLHHADVIRLSNDPRLVSTETAIPDSRGVSEGSLHQFFSHGMLTVNGAHHERRRSLISRSLSMFVATQFRAHVRDATESLIDAVYEDGQVEFVSHFADQIPILALAGLLGVSDQERSAFMVNICELSRFFSPSSSEADIKRSSEAMDFLRDFLMQKIAEPNGADDQAFIAAFKSACFAEGVPPLEAAIQIIQLIIGGTESVRASIVAQTSLLLLNRSQWNSVCDDPDLIPAAVDEAMRYQPGIAGLVRLTTEKIELQGETLPAQALVILSTLSALRDETVYHRPDIFDIRRADSTREHLAFGAGPHRCVADHLARIELEECLHVLSQRLPNLRLDDIPVFNGHVFIRVPSCFCVSWPV